MATNFRSNADHTRLISKSIFVTNFPDNTLSKDLWKLCQDYGTVVDVYIPNRKSKAGKCFAFVRFIKVENIDRLVGNNCTLWIGRMHLHANVVCFERSPIQASRSASSVRPNHTGASSFATVLKGNNTPVNASEAPAMVIDDSCVVKRDIEFFCNGRRGLWVMFELESLKSKAKFMQHVGVASWFTCLCNAQSDFVSRDRIVWVDIEGVPLHAWSRATFTKIGSKWGEVMDLEESKDDLFARKRICIKTKQEDNILEKFKIIVKGKNFVIRAKELFAWSPVFNEVKEVEYCTDDESVQGTNEDKGEVSNKVQPNPESDDEGVSDTYFGESEENLGNEHNSEQPMNDKEKSQDPFNFYDLLRKRDGGVDTLGSNISIPYPPGFTPEKLNNNADVNEVKDMNSEPSERRSEDLCSRVLEEVQHTDDLLSSGVRSNGHMPKKGGSVLEVLDEMIKVGQTMGYTMEGWLGSKAKKDWTRELIGKHKVNFLSLQETKMESISDMDVKILWGNSNFEYLFSEAIGNSGGILCTWDPNIFLKEQHILSDNFVALFGTWVPTKTKLLMISIYAPQPRTEKRSLWNYIMSLVTRWQGDSIVMGDFNEVRSADERMGSVFNIQGAADFNDFISNSGLVDIQLEGYLFTWSHPSASKMSKLDRFLVTEGVISLFPHISAICLDMHLSDHRPILLRDVIADYGATPFRLYHSWLTLSGFEQLVIHTWNSTVLEDSNGMVQFKKKLQVLKKAIREWVAVYKREKTGRRNDIKLKLSVIDKQLDQGHVNDDILLSRMGLMKQLLNSNSLDAIDNLQKAKIQWAIEGDENSKFFHGVINQKRANLAIRGVMVDGEWMDDPRRVKEEFCSHFATRFPDSCSNGIQIRLNYLFPNQLSSDQAFELEKQVSTDEIRTAVWACGENKSPGPDGFTFSNFVVTKILALRLSSVIAGLISDVQTAFLPSRQILDGSFVINELLSCLSSGMASVLINESPTAEFHFHCGLKQGDPLAPYLFILVMESLHLSFSRVVDAGIFKGIKIDNSTMISYLFYADDVGVGIHDLIVAAAASTLGCSIMKTPFKYLGVTVGAIHGPNIQKLSSSTYSIWNNILKEVNILKGRGVDLISHCKRRVGNGMHTWFWSDLWLGDQQLRYMFPRIYALEENKECSVAVKLQGDVEFSLRRQARGGVEAQQLVQLQDLIGSSVLVNAEDRWFWDLNGNGVFCVKDVHKLLDESFLPKEVIATRWIKFVSIKINVFAWKVSLDRLPIRLRHAADVTRLVCRWWDLVWSPLGSYSEWSSWFNSIRLGSNLKSMLEGVFLLGGAYGTSGIDCSLRLKSLGRM
ncbi:RNA-directed DNA polymerase, eukaryota [Tanacetum coccineum]|uniref:RNA-directed DNA polymerase, eukaryota n=1 Tax=Tanacetum coccineum TaxID=301880 RepID=A0ABQ5BMN8_9ASTR